LITYCRDRAVAAPSLKIFAQHANHAISAKVIVRLMKQGCRCCPRHLHFDMVWITLRYIIPQEIALNGESICSCAKTIPM
jgi:hypothetical protein